MDKEKQGIFCECIASYDNLKDVQKLNICDPRIVKPFCMEENNSFTFFQVLLDIRNRDQNFVIPMPNTISLFLSISKQNMNAAFKLQVEIFHKYPDIDNDVLNSDCPKVFDSIQHLAVGIVFLYMAVESMANSCLHKDTIYRKPKGNGKIEEFDKNGIERFIPTSEKLKEILPNILQIESPATKPFWNSFLKLEEIRNRIVHCKENAMPTLIKDMYDSTLIIKIANDTIKLLNYYISKDKYNLLFPFGFGDSYPPIIKKDETLSTEIPPDWIEREIQSDNKKIRGLIKRTHQKDNPCDDIWFIELFGSDNQFLWKSKAPYNGYPDIYISDDGSVVLFLERWYLDTKPVLTFINSSQKKTYIGREIIQDPQNIPKTITHRLWIHEAIGFTENNTYKIKLYNNQIFAAKYF